MKHWRITLRTPRHTVTQLSNALRVQLSIINNQMDGSYLQARLEGGRLALLSLEAQRRLVRQCLLEQLREEAAEAEVGEMVLAAVESRLTVIH